MAQGKTKKKARKRARRETSELAETIKELRQSVGAGFLVEVELARGRWHRFTSVSFRVLAEELAARLKKRGYRVRIREL